MGTEQPPAATPAARATRLPPMLQNVTKCDTFTADPSVTSAPSSSSIGANPCPIGGSTPLSDPPDPNFPDLSPRQSDALALLLAGQTISAVAEKLDVSRQTIHRWKSSPAFAAHLARLQADHLDAIAQSASQALVKSFSLIIQHIDKRNTDFAVKVLSALKAYRFIAPPAPAEAADAQDSPAPQSPSSDESSLPTSSG